MSGPGLDAAGLLYCSRWCTFSIYEKTISVGSTEEVLSSILASNTVPLHGTINGHIVWMQFMTQCLDCNISKITVLMGESIHIKIMILLRFCINSKTQFLYAVKNMMLTEQRSSLPRDLNRHGTVQHLKCLQCAHAVHLHLSK